MECTKFNRKDRQGYDRICLPKALMDKLWKQPNPGDVNALYLFYRYVALWQKTDQPKAENKYCMKGLHWGKDRFSRAQKSLFELGLIQRVQVRHVDGYVKHWYVKVNMVWDDKTHYNTENSIVVQKRRDQLQVLKTTCSKQDTNTLKTNNSVVRDFTNHFPKQWKNNVPLKKALQDYIEYCTQRGKKLTPITIEKLAKKLTGFGSAQKVIEAINRTIVNGWSGIYPEKVNQPKDGSNMKPPIYDNGIKYIYDKKDGLYHHCVSGEIYIP
jgi:hypothetical protein